MFCRQFCKREFAKAGIAFDVKQISFPINPNAGTLRGLHVQKKPYEEAKIVSCMQGKIFDVLADMRPDSPTYLQWVGVELFGDNRKIYVALLVLRTASERCAINVSYVI